MSMGGAHLDSLPRLQGGDSASRFSSGGPVGPPLSKEPSVSTAEEYLGWSEGEGGGAVSVAADQQQQHQHQRSGPFTDSSLVMARLRLPNMELGFEEDGFFGIDVRSLIIGREIARGAYGVVHEAVLLQQRPEEGKSDEAGGEEGRGGTGAF